MRFRDRLKMAAAVLRSAPPGMYMPYGLQTVMGLVGQPSMRKQLEAYTGWVYKCVAFRAREVAAADFTVMTSVKGELVPVGPLHLAQRLLAKPNPFEPRFYFLQRAHTMLDLTGNVFILIMRNQLGLPAEMWILDPTHVTIVPDKEKVIARYEYRLGDRVYTFEPRDIVHVKYPHPTDFYYGASPLMAAAYEYDIDLASKKYQMTTFQNAGVPPKYVIEAEGYLTKETRDALREELILSHTGDRAGGPMILQQGAKARTFSLSPVELDFIATRKFTRDEIVTFYGVPNSIFGISEDVNRANAEANHYTVARYTIQPLVNMWTAWLTANLISQFGPEYELIGQDVVPENREAARLDLKNRIDAGVSSINEERARLGLDPVDGGDVPTIPSGRMLITELGAKETEPAEPPAPDPEGTPDPADPEDDSEDAEKAMASEKAVRGTYWRRVAALQLRAERQLHKRLRGYFAEQAVTVLKAMGRSKAIAGGTVAKGDDPVTGVAIDIDVNKSQWDEILIELGLDAMSAQMKAAWDLAMKEMESGKQFTMTREVVRNAMKASLERMKDVNTETVDTLLKVLDEGINEGENIEQLSARVMDVFKTATEGRARRIARTISTQSTNAGIDASFQEEAALIEKKGWASSRDRNTRDAHANADGQEVAPTALFLVGGESLRYPGDPNGSPGNIINCRCFVYPVKKSK